ncbi:MAG: TrbG/VirB9 family P-type conjugative transfer protein [Thermoanaerobaculia bacterium]
MKYPKILTGLLLIAGAARLEATPIEKPTIPETRSVTFGDPVVARTAVLRATGLVLNADEHLRSVSQPDSERWQVAWSEYGPEGETVPVVTITPSECGIATNLLILTTARIYPVRLESAGCDAASSLEPELPYDMLIRYRYPGEALVKAVPQPPRESRARFGAPLDQVLAASSRYHVAPKGGYRGPRPQLVTDDGQATYLVFAEHAFDGKDLPLLFLLSDQGERELANYDVSGSVFRVLGLLDRAVLVPAKPQGKRASELVITRR